MRSIKRAGDRKERDEVDAATGALQGDHVFQSCRHAFCVDGFDFKMEGTGYCNTEF